MAQWLWINMVGCDRTLLGPLLEEVPGFTHWTEKIKFNRNLLVLRHEACGRNTASPSYRFIVGVCTAWIRIKKELISQIYFWNKILRVFRTVPLSIIRSFFFTVHTAMVHVIQVCWQLASRIRTFRPSTFYMFRTVPLSIIGSFSLYTRRCYMS